MIEYEHISYKRNFKNEYFFRRCNMVIGLLVILTIFVLCLLATFVSIYIDVYDILKLKDTEVNINLVKFKKCILPYEKGTCKQIC